MGSAYRWWLAMLVLGCSALKLVAQCPDRPVSGTVVNDALSLSSQNGTLSAQLTMGHSVDGAGYTHYCYNYNAGSEVIEAPTLRVNPGDQLVLDIVNRIQNNDPMKVKMQGPMPMTM